LKELVSALERRFPIDPVLSMGKMGIIRPCMIKKKYLFVYHGQPYWGFAAERDTGLSSFGVGPFFFLAYLVCGDRYDSITLAIFGTNTLGKRE